MRYEHAAVYRMCHVKDDIANLEDMQVVSWMVTSWIVEQSMFPATEAYT